MLNTQDLSDISTSEDTLQEHTTQSVIEIQTDSDDNMMMMMMTTRMRKLNLIIMMIH